jgi:endonuclease YncB( thermonuclease family)
MKTTARILLLAVAAFPAAAQTSGSASGTGGPTANCASSMGELPKTWDGKAYAVSGDTMAGIGLKPRLRLWGVRAPELGPDLNVPAMRARAALEDMLAAGEHKVSCRVAGWDRLCRAVSQCTITAEWPAGSKAQPHDLAVRLVEDGFAYGFELGSPPDWDKDASEKIAHFEAISRQGHKGLWPDWLGEPAKP